jgi:hypothetical protein
MQFVGFSYFVPMNASRVGDHIRAIKAGRDLSQSGEVW